MSKQKQSGGDSQEYRVETIQIGNVTVTLRRPILTAEERSQAEEDVKHAICNLMDAAYEEKKRAAQMQPA